MCLAIRSLCNFAGMLAASILCQRSSSPFAVAVWIVNGDPCWSRSTYSQCSFCSLPSCFSGSFDCCCLTSVWGCCQWKQWCYFLCSCFRWFFGSFLNFFLGPSTIIVFFLCDPVAILGTLNQDIIPVAVCCTLINVSFTFIVCVLCIMSTEARPCQQHPSQVLMWVFTIYYLHPLRNKLIYFFAGYINSLV